MSQNYMDNEMILFYYNRINKITYLEFCSVKRTLFSIKSQLVFQFSITKKLLETFSATDIDKIRHFLKILKFLILLNK